MALPDEITTAEKVKAWAKIGDAVDDASLVEIVTAVNALVGELPVVKNLPDDATEYPAYVSTGATMLAARLWRRRNTPEGVAVFGQDGAVYVQRNDPDVATLLKLNRPAVG